MWSSTPTAARTGRGMIDDAGAHARPKAERPAKPHRSPKSASTRAPSSCTTQRGRSVETLTNVELALAWPSISKSFAATGRFAWHDEPIDTSISLTDFAAALRRRPLRREGPAQPARRSSSPSTAAEPPADAEDRRHARRRHRLAARHAALGRRAAAARRRLRPLRAEGQDQRRRRNDRALHRQRRARRQRRRRRPHLCHRRPADAARHARRRTSSISRLTFPPSACCTSNERDWNRVPIAIDGLNGFDLDLRLSAARITLGARQARPHRRRRQPARRQAQL